MSAHRRIGAAAGAALASLALLGPGAAQGATGPAINEAGSPSFPERAYLRRIPESAALDQGDVSVRENGVRVAEFTISSAAQSGAGSFATVLVIDASNSMSGQAIAEAMNAARAFAERRAPGQQLGVITFSGRPQVLLPLTTDTAQIDQALATEPELAPATRVYDATSAALGMLDEAGVQAGSVVVLSDGADTGSAASLSEVTDRAEAAGIRVFTVGLRSGRFDASGLEPLAVGGAFVAANDPDDLGPIFDRFGSELASEYLLRYSSKSEAGQAVTVEVGVEGLAGTARDFYEAPASGPPPSSDPVDKGIWDSTGAMILAIAIAAGLLGSSLFLLARPRRETVRQRLNRFLAIEAYADVPDPVDRGDRSVRSALGPIERSLAGRRWWTQFNEELDVAKVEVPAITIVSSTFVATVLVSLLFAQVLGVPILIPLALLIPFSVRTRINYLLRTQREEFADQLADNLQMVASALRAGQSMMGAFGVVVEQSPEPSRNEFRRIVADERLGIPLEDAIRDVARRMESRDMEQLALVAKIQRETGGNTAEVLDQLIATIRERGALRRLMRTLTAQGRLTQIIVSVLPLFLLAAVSLLQPDYMKPLFETGGGRIALTIGATLSVIGSLAIRRIVAVRV